MKFPFVPLLLLGGLAVPAAGWAQAAGESAATPAQAEAATTPASAEAVTPPLPAEAAATPVPAEAATTPVSAAPTNLVQAGEPTVQRSALWRTIDAHHRQADPPMSGADRRLTPEQLLELREQVRQAWEGVETGQTTASAASGTGNQP